MLYEAEILALWPVFSSWKLKYFRLELQFFFTMNPDFKENRYVFNIFPSSENECSLKNGL